MLQSFNPHGKAMVKDPAGIAGHRQAGGFSAIVLDLGSIASEHVSRITLATRFRYGAAAERIHL
jgi:hypothetical protein